MEEQLNQDKKSGFSKRIIAIIAIALVVFGGSVAAYVALNKSTKDTYFAAEKNTIDFVADQFEERFASELKWLEYTEKNPTETSVELSGEYNDPYGSGGYDMFSPEQIINGSSLTIKTQSDMEKKKIATEVIANVGGMKIDDINFYLTDKSVMLGLPFLNELLQVKNEDIIKLLHEIDPEFASTLNEEDIDLGKLFETKESFLLDEDIAYFEKEYFKMIHEELTDDNFTSTDEKVEIGNESINTEKITLQIEEQELKDLITKVLDKLHKDEKVKDLIKKQIGTTALVDDDISHIISDYEAGILELKDAIKDLHIPDGLTSTIWVEKKLVVKRDFAITMGPSADELVTLTVNGTQLLEKDTQTFDYNFGFEDSYEEGTLNISGDLSWKDDKISDSIKLTVDEFELSYQADETVKNGKRDFNRIFSITNPYEAGGSLVWSGNSTYEKDKMSSEHALSVDADGFDQDLFALHLAIDGKKIKSVDIPEDKTVKDIGSMTEEEIMDYIENDAAVQFQQWIMGIMGGSGLGF